MKRKTGQFTKKVGRKIKFERTKQNISQLQFAKMSDMSDKTLYKIENGTISLSLETANDIANALKIPLPELINVDKLEL